MEEKPLRGKAAIVTGGTRGIGRAIVERLLDEGVRVSFCGLHADSVARAVRELSSKGDVLGRVADVSRLDDVRTFVAAVKQLFGDVQILVNNAGAGIFRSVADLPPLEWNTILGVNLSGAYYCSHEALPLLRAAGGGDVINIGSLAGRNAFAGGAAYNASKFGLRGFSEAMMLDHRNDGVRVSCVMPGSVDTEFGGTGVTENSNWKIQPSDIADVVMMLLRMPRRTTVSSVEIRPSTPRKG